MKATSSNQIIDESDLSAKTAAVLKSLRAHAEGSTTSDAAGRIFKQVYLDNAIPNGMSPRSFAGYLSVLQQFGFYRTQGDDCFGDVLMPKEAA